MKKVISGKKYDTETAQEMGAWYYGNIGDFEYTEEVLYRKRSGEFFLYGYGGAMSKYAEDLGNGNIGSGERITPLSYAKAQDWAEKHLSGDEYEKIFGEIEESDEVSRINTAVSKKTFELFKRISAKRNSGLQETIENIILEEARRLGVD